MRFARWAVRLLQRARRPPSDSRFDLFCWSVALRSSCNDPSNGHELNERANFGPLNRPIQAGFGGTGEHLAFIGLVQ